MDFVIFFAILLVNVLTAKFFKPYSQLFVGMFKDISILMSKKKYTTMKRVGNLLTVVGATAIWLTLGLITPYVTESFVIYGYIIYGLTIYFCVGAGQIIGLLRKLANNFNNEVFAEELYGRLMIKDFSAMNDKQRSKAVISALARVVSEKIINPVLYVLILGPGAAWAYKWINTVAISDNHPDVRLHGFADGAIFINKILSVPGYFAASVLLRLALWVFGIKINCKGLPFMQKCERAFQCLTDGEPDSLFYKRAAAVISVTVLVGAVAAVCTYIFVQAAWAGIGLGEYWNFWNKDANG